MTIKPICTPPTQTEMQSRINRLRDNMQKAGLNYLVAQCPDNVFYLTNFANYVHERPFIIVLGLEGPLRFVVPKLEIPHVKIRSIGDIELIEYFEFPAPQGQSWADRFAALFEPGAQVGLESTCPLFVQQALPCSSIIHDAIEDARMVKSDYELGRIIYASDLATESMNMLLSDARPGKSLIEINSQIRSHMMLKIIIDAPNTNVLATDLGIACQPPSVSHDPHNFTDIAMALEEGGPNVALINGTINGYGTEVERTFFLGHVPDAARRPYDVMMAARQLAFDLIKPGAVMGQVDKAVNDLMRQAGYGENLLHRTGHSIGVTGHEGPFLAEGYDRVIEEGMIFTIEPGLYIEGIGGFRHSDTVMVTDLGAISLTPCPADLDAMTIPLVAAA